MPSNIQDATAAGMNLFDASVNQRRRNLAFNAFQSAYGDAAGDPETFGKLDAIKQNQELQPLKMQEAQQNIDAAAKLNPLKLEEAKNTVAKGGADLDAEAQKRKQQALLNLALGVKSAAARGEDPLAAFDKLVPLLGDLPPELAQKMRAGIQANPAGVDDFVSALTDQTRRQQDPAAVSEYQYFSKLDDKGKAAYMDLKRAGTTSIKDIGGVPTVVHVDGSGTQSVIPLSSLGKEAGAAQTLADAKGTGTAEGTARGKVNAEDLPLSETGKVKAKTGLEATKQTFDVADATIDKAIGDTGWLSAGPLSALPDFLNPSAANLRGELTTVTSKVVLDTIQEMKSVSKTGATGFGQLSDREGQLIQSRLGAVLQAATPKRLKAALTELQNQLAKSRARFENAYTADLAARAPKPSDSDTDLLKKYGLE